MLEHSFEIEMRGLDWGRAKVEIDRVGTCVVRLWWGIRMI